MISKTDYYLGVFLIMLAVLAPRTLGPLTGAEIMGEEPVLGFISLVSWFGAIFCMIIKIIGLFSKSKDR